MARTDLSSGLFFFTTDGTELNLLNPLNPLNFLNPLNPLNLLNPLNPLNFLNPLYPLNPLNLYLCHKTKT